MSLKSSEKSTTSTPRKCSKQCCLIDYLLVFLNVAVRVFCTFYMIISDCDETYNYWEPLNLLLRGFGKQTWEYLPEWSIRSYFFLLPYYLVTSPLRDFEALTGAKIPSYAYFYFIRLVALCGFTSLAENVLAFSLRKTIGKSVARWFLLLSTVSTGMAHAGVALLPSSFAMTWLMLATAFLLYSFKNTNECTYILSTAFGVFSLAIGGIVGWPFALSLGTPFAVFTLGRRLPLRTLAKLALLCVAFLAVLCGLITIVDSFFYKTKLFVPMNIVLYNVFTAEGEGPEIFGTEPFSYYVKNLLLNFNFVLPAAVGGSVLALIGKLDTSELVTVTLPLLLWSTIFGLQAHKEERFVYPVYPLINILASSFFVALNRLITSSSLRKAFTLLAGSVIITVSFLRTARLVEGYSAPLFASQVFSHVETGPGIKNVCVGEEWYHFPTSLFLPDDFRLRFIKSGFDGLLPGDFPEGGTLQEATAAIPYGMNSKNLFSADKLVDVAVCDFFVDKVTEESAKGEVIRCEEMVDTAKPGSGLARLLYLPEFVKQALQQDPATMQFCVIRPRQ